MIQKMPNIFKLMILDFENLFVFAAYIFKTVIKLMQRIIIGIKQLRNNCKQGETSCQTLNRKSYKDGRSKEFWRR